MAETVIKNYGFLWERSQIKRGRGESLSGYATARGNTVDFADQIGVYALYDKTQSIVYVGQAGNGNATLLTRLKQHMDGSSLWNRWEYFSWVGFKDVTTSGLSKKQDTEAYVTRYKYGDALNEIEGILIEFIEPKLNKQGGRLKGAREYFQTPIQQDDTLSDIGRAVDEMGKRLEALAKKLDKKT